MNDFLKKIIAGRRQDICKAKKEVSLKTLQGKLETRRQMRSLIAFFKPGRTTNAPISSPR